MINIKKTSIKTDSFPESFGQDSFTYYKGKRFKGAIHCFSVQEQKDLWKLKAEGGVRVNKYYQVFDDDKFDFLDPQNLKKLWTVDEGDLFGNSHIHSFSEQEYISAKGVYLDLHSKSLTPHFKSFFEEGRKDLCYAKSLNHVVVDDYGVDYKDEKTVYIVDLLNEKINWQIDSSKFIAATNNVIYTNCWNDEKNSEIKLQVWNWQAELLNEITVINKELFYNAMLDRIDKDKLILEIRNYELGFTTLLQLSADKEETIVKEIPTGIGEMYSLIPSGKSRLLLHRNEKYRYTLHELDEQFSVLDSVNFGNLKLEFKDNGFNGDQYIFGESKKDSGPQDIFIVSFDGEKSKSEPQEQKNIEAQENLEANSSMPNFRLYLDSLISQDEENFFYTDQLHTVIEDVERYVYGKKLRKNQGILRFFVEDSDWGKVDSYKGEEHQQISQFITENAYSTASILKQFKIVVKKLTADSESGILDLDAYIIQELEEIISILKENPQSKACLVWD